MLSWRPLIIIIRLHVPFPSGHIRCSLVRYLLLKSQSLIETTNREDMEIMPSKNICMCLFSLQVINWLPHETVFEVLLFNLAVASLPAELSMSDDNVFRTVDSQAGGFRIERHECMQR